MNKEKLRQIFIEEAGEIIEKLDIDIVNLEERPGDKGLMNELFRGVHTLKGSANSFGFTRLGQFVHGFEDVLDHYRNSEDEANSRAIDIFLSAVDVIKEVLSFEIDGNESVPGDYHACLDGFKELLGGGGHHEPKEQAPQAPLNDLSAEFGEIESVGGANESERAFLEQLLDGEQLFKISLKFDSDIYLRGQDHAIFLKLLTQNGRVLGTKWDMKSVPKLSELDPSKCYIGEVDIYLATQKDENDIRELFEYLEEYEFKVEPVESKSAVVVMSQSVEVVTQKSKPSEEPKESEKKTQGDEPKKDEPKAQSDEKRSFVKIDTIKLDELFDSVGELVIAQNFLGENSAIKNLNDENVAKTIETLSKITRLIQNRVMSLRMVPIRDTFDKMKRVVRDASRKVNKEVKLQIYGEDTEIDKTMVDALSDPLIHIIRNAVDHGLEATAEDRIKAGKTPEGSVTIRAHHKGGNIVIEIAEDGRGINKEKVLAKAIEKGLVEPNEELSEAQVFALIMQPGFSTADKISDISGRGVGLDVVRTSIEGLRGKIEIDSKAGKGTKFSIYLPLTLAIIDGMLVKSGGEIFIIPTLSILESFRPSDDIVHTAQGKGEFVKLRQELLPIVRLNDILELDNKRPKPSECTLVCAENDKGRFAILVDELIGRQQVVIKTLGKTLAHLKEVSGGAVMGNGEIALILNVEGLY